MMAGEPRPSTPCGCLRATSSCGDRPKSWPLKTTTRPRPSVSFASTPARASACPRFPTRSAYSRRVLERRFQQYLGRTPKDEILRVKIDRVKFLLSQTHMAIENIAHNSGFPSFKNLAKLFLREAGITPLAYRKANRIVCETPPEEIL